MRLPGIIMLSLAALALAGGFAPSDSLGKPLYGGAVLRVAQYEPALTGAASARSILEREMASLDRSRLVEVNDDGLIRAGIIESWHPADDGLELKLVPRAGVRDASGDPLTPYDIVAGLENLLHLNPDSAAARLLLDVKGAEEFVAGGSDRIEGITVDDGGAIVISLERPQPLLLFALSDINAAPERPGRGGTGWGAFLRLDGPIFEPDLSFFRGRPFIDRLYYGLRAEVEEGWRRPVLVRVGERMQDVGSQAREISYPGRRCVYLAVNKRGSAGPLHLLDARVAVLAAIDRVSLVSIFLGDNAEVLEHIVPSSIFPAGAFQSSPPPRSSVKPVRRLLIGYLERSEELKLVAERVKVDLLVAGIGADAAPCNFDSAKDCDLILVEKPVHDGCAAYAVWSLLCELTEIERDGIWLRRPWGDEAAWLVELEAALRSEALLLPLYHTSRSAWAEPRLRDLSFRPDGTLDFENAWIAEESGPDGEIKR